MSKYLKIIFVVLIWACTAKAQTNLVLNPSFEDTVNCPQGYDQVYLANAWSSFGNSSDYFNSCAPISLITGVSVPYNFAGYQQAASGSAYCGLVTYWSSIKNYREYLGQTLSTPLSIGVKYYVSFKINLSVDSTTQNVLNCATNKIGSLFSVMPYNEISPPSLKNSSKVYMNSVINDTLNWTKVFGSFIADSAYKYIIIGNFFDDSHTDTLIIGTYNYCNSYYFVDDVCLSTDSLFTLDYTDIKIKEQPQIKVYPNPFSNSIFISMPELLMPFDLTLFDNQGNKLIEKINNKERDLILDVLNLDKSIYLLHIKYNNRVYNYKLIKQ